jgi:hypothetical protein
VDIILATRAVASRKLASTLLTWIDDVARQRHSQVETERVNFRIIRFCDGYGHSQHKSIAFGRLTAVLTLKQVNHLQKVEIVHIILLVTAGALLT